MTKRLKILNALYNKRDTRVKQLHAAEQYGMWTTGQHMAARENLLDEIKIIDQKINGVYQKALETYGQEFENILLDIITSQDWQVKQTHGKT